MAQLVYAVFPLVLGWIFFNILPFASREGPIPAAICLRMLLFGTCSLCFGSVNMEISKAELGSVPFGLYQIGMPRYSQLPGAVLFLHKNHPNA